MDKAKQSNPDASWWVKGDGVDVVKGLFESTHGVWSGDVDLSDGKLEQKFRNMCERLDFVNTLGLRERRDSTVLINDLELLLQESKEDSKFI